MISAEYLEQLKLTNGKLWIGTRAWHKCRFDILKVIDERQCDSVLDFGAAEGTLGSWLHEQRPDLAVYNYDPRIEGMDSLPDEVDLVVSTDVLEHVEPDRIEETLAVLGSIAVKAQYHCISTRKAGARLPDGRNAHLTVNPPEWWKKQLQATGWTVVAENGYHSIVEFELVRDINSPEYWAWHDRVMTNLNDIVRNET